MTRAKPPTPFPTYAFIACNGTDRQTGKAFLRSDGACTPKHSASHPTRTLLGLMSWCHSSLEVNRMLCMPTYGYLTCGCVQDVATAHRPLNILPLKRHASKPIETMAYDSNLVYWRIFRGPWGTINGGAASTATSLSSAVFISLQHANKESADHSYGNCQERGSQCSSTSHNSWNMEFIWIISENSVPTSQKTHIDYKEQQVNVVSGNNFVK